MNLQIPLLPVESSQLAAIGHDPDTNTLAVRFKGKDGPGALYHYRNFTAEQFAEFQAAPSKGAFFGTRIKRATEQHPYVRVVEKDESAA